MKVFPLLASKKRVRVGSAWAKGQLFNAEPSAAHRARVPLRNDAVIQGDSHSQGMSEDCPPGFYRAGHTPVATRQPPVINHGAHEEPQTHGTHEEP